MSGPKYSKAELKRMEQERRERERLAELRRIEEEKRRLENAKRQYESVLAQVMATKNSFLEQIENSNNHNSESLKRSVLELFSTIRFYSVNNETEAEYLKACELVNKQLSTVNERIKKEIMYTVQDESMLKNMLKNHNEFVHLAESNIEIEPIVIDFSCDFDEKELLKEIDEEKNHLKVLLVKPNPKLKQLAEESLNVLSEYEEKGNLWEQRASIRNTIQKMINKEVQILEFEKSFDELYVKYTALCEITNKPIKDKKEFITLDDLTNEIDVLNDLYRQQDELDFIADAVNSVMLDQGYRTVSSDVLYKDNKEMDKTVYMADEEVGVEVYTGQDGTVMMQIALFGDDEITESDRELSLEMQESFCDNHPEIVEALEKKGVILTQKEYYAPNKRFTKKVAVETEVMEEAVETEKKVNRKERRRAKNKAKTRAMRY